MALRWNETSRKERRGRMKMSGLSAWISRSWIERTQPNESQRTSPVRAGNVEGDAPRTRRHTLTVYAEAQDARQVKPREASQIQRGVGEASR